MKQTYTLSEPKFEARHPGVELKYKEIFCTSLWSVKAYKDGRLIAHKLSKTKAEALYWISQSILRLNVRSAAASQGWRDGNTGAITALQGHHVKPRSKGRDDSEENISAIGAQTHDIQHKSSHGEARITDAEGSEDR